MPGEEGEFLQGGGGVAHLHICRPEKAGGASNGGMGGRSLGATSNCELREAPACSWEGLLAGERVRLLSAKRHRLEGGPLLTGLIQTQQRRVVPRVPKQGDRQRRP